MHGGMLKHNGATLIELVVTIVVIAIVVTTLMVFTSQSTGRSADPMIEQQASALAQAYLEEITQKGFCDPDFDVDADPATPLVCPLQCTGPVCQAGGCRHSGSAQESDRELYDDICDYDGLNDAGARDQNGDAIPGLDQYRIAIDVVDSASLNGLNGANGEAARIDITVSHPAMPHTIELSGFRANY